MPERKKNSMRKSVLITGASRGIGNACAKEFAKNGYDLYLTCLHSFDKLKALQQELTTQYGISCRIFTCDMSRYEDVALLFSEIKTLDVLINNAGVSYIGLLQDMTVAEWEAVLHTNLDSCFYTAKCAIPLMLSRKQGRILNVSSVWGSVGASMECAYSASKGGVNAFTRALAKELAPSNIQVNAVSFGMIDTDMNRCFSEEEKNALIDEIPACRIGSCKEAAALLLQLASAPAYLTGQVITMDGGWI